MAVSFTPNIGLAKPDDNELAANFTRFTNLHEDNLVIIENKMNLPQPQSYSCTVIGPTTNPSFGASGTVTGEYYEFEGWVFGGFVIRIAGAGVSVGSGTGAYGISLPFRVNTPFHNISGTLNADPGFLSVVGEGYFADASAVNTSGTCAVDVVTIGATSYARLITEAYTGKTNRFVGPNFPVAIADGDSFSGNFIYKKL